MKELEDEIVELKFQLKQSKDNEMKYLAILQDIDKSLIDIFNREKENERFQLGEVFNFRESCINLQNYINDCKRIYKIRL
jgi:hypothetical protein